MERQSRSFLTLLALIVLVAQARSEPLAPESQVATATDKSPPSAKEEKAAALKQAGHLPRRNDRNVVTGLTIVGSGRPLGDLVKSKEQLAERLHKTQGGVKEHAVPASTMLFPVIKDRKMGFIDQHGQIVIEPQFNLSHVGLSRTERPETARVLADTFRDGDDAFERPGAYPVRFPSFHDGVAMVVKDDRVGYVRRGGRILTPPVFRAGADFADGVAWALAENGQYCLLDNEGKIRIENLEACSPFAEGLAVAKIRGKYGYVDDHGTIVVPACYDSAEPFSEGRACVAEGPQQWLIQRQGQRLAAVRGRMERFSEGMAVLWDPATKRAGYIGADGKQVIAPRFDEAGPFKEGLAAVAVKRKFGFIDQQGRFVIEPRFDHAGPFAGGRAIVRVGDSSTNRTREAVINRQGEYIVKPQYASISPLPGGACIVQTADKKRGVMDAQGRFVIEPRFQVLDSVDGGYRVATQEGRFGFLDLAGKSVLPEEYFDIGRMLTDGLRCVGKAVDGVGKFGFVDASGKMVIPAQFDYAEDFDHGLARIAVGVDLYLPAASVVAGGKWGYIDRTGAWVWKPTR